MDPILLQRIKDEITNDPDNKGYAGKTNQEIADLMNQSTITKTDILQPPEPIVVPPPPVGTKIGETIIVKDAPVLKLIVGIPGVPNVITVDEVTASLK